MSCDEEKNQKEQKKSDSVLHSSSIKEKYQSKLDTSLQLKSHYKGSPKEVKTNNRTTS